MDENQDDFPFTWLSLVLVVIVILLALALYAVIVFYAPSKEIPEMINISISSP